MKIDYYVRPYELLLENLLESYDQDEAMSLIVGGLYDEVGKLEYHLLKFFGLEKNHNILDIGCGSGRLAYSLKNFLLGKYVGYDILMDPLNYAKKKCSREDWEFNLIDGDNLSFSISNSFNFVTFFSVFTHILDEDMFIYLQESSRVLEPDGKIIFSFLDFECESHWTIFENSLTERNQDRVMNRFLSRSTIQVWAKKLGLTIDHIFDGNKSFIPLSVQNSDDDNEISKTSKSAFGQSVAVLSFRNKECY